MLNAKSYREVANSFLALLTLTIKWLCAFLRVLQDLLVHYYNRHTQTALIIQSSEITVKDTVDHIVLIPKDCV